MALVELLFLKLEKQAVSLIPLHLKIIALVGL